MCVLSSFSIPTAGSAQSVLERVLGQVENSTNLAPVNGVYANIAEAFQSRSFNLLYVDPDSGATLSLSEFQALANSPLRIDFAAIPPEYYINDNYDGAVSPEVYSSLPAFVSPLEYFALLPSERLEYRIVGAVPFYYEAGNPRNIISAEEFVDLFIDAADREEALSAFRLVPVKNHANVLNINGSINNTVTGVVEATALVTASLATATEFTLPTMEFGNMATTALGVVNTGDIVLGVNSAVDEAETTYTNAISAALSQIGGSVDTGAVVINVASNMSAVDGSITNVMSQVNGTIGNLSTTALGAVNTGTITSGVDAAVQGIVGMSGQ